VIRFAFTVVNIKRGEVENAKDGGGKIVNYKPVLNWSSFCIHTILKLTPQSLAGASICIAVMEESSIVPLTVSNLVMWKCRCTVLWNLAKPHPINP